MFELKFPRGSEWRRWDLHVHTPHSALNNGFGADFDGYARVLFQEAVAAGIAVIGITDYFTINGYRGLRDLVLDDERLVALLGSDIASAAREIVLIPNVELRTRDIVHTTAGDARVNLHVLFSEELSPDEIEDHFLHGLRFTLESGPESADEERPLTIANLEELGRELKAQHVKFMDRSDLVVGMTTAVVSLKDVTDVLSRQKRRFGDKHLIVLAADEDLSKVNWDGQGHLVRKQLIQRSHMLFSGNPRTRAFGLGEFHETPAAFKEEFKSLKPCIHGSDAHSPGELFRPAEDRRLWIKADPGFKGLRQLLHEPADRVYIGLEPPLLARVRASRTKYMSHLAFSRVSETQAGEKWFSGGVPLNPGLVAVIGNKGSGKSAFADVLGLVGNARTHSDFAFLNEGRFLAPRRGLGGLFRADLTWADGSSAGRCLDEGIEPSLPERIQYLPQNYLESVCSGIDDATSERFDEELEAVIFSHVEAADRLGKTTLRDLIDHRSSEKQSRIEQLTGKLRDINARIVEFEEHSTDRYRRFLEGLVQHRETELAAHDETEPEEPPLPDGTSASGEDIASAELAALLARIAELDSAIDATNARRGANKARIAAVDRLVDRIVNLSRRVDAFYDASAEDTALTGHDIRALVKVQIDEGALTQLRAALEEETSGLDAAVNVGEPGSLTSERADLMVQAEKLRAELTAPARRYEQYRQELRSWRGRRDEILGSVDDLDSLAALRARVGALKLIPDQLEQERAARRAIVGEIWAVKEALVRDYQRLHSPVQSFLDEHPVAEKVDALSFSASFVVDGLEEGFLRMIHQGRRGSFQGESDGRAQVRRLVSRYDFSSWGNVLDFLEEFERMLHVDVREEDKPAVELLGQLNQSFLVQDVYDYIFGLEYLRPRFELLWQERPLDQLSPGERGTLLLIFYLLIDRRDDPLVIDQPEENLDNETIATLLVPAMKHAKSQRQLVIVTHNPNLAVVCDADQIVHASIDKADGNRITYASGGIESPGIAKAIVDVLEGTKPAFDLRDAKYDVLET